MQEIPQLVPQPKINEPQRGRGRKHHYLKCETAFYQAIERNEKKFELRKNDRDFKVGDMIYLRESVKGIETGRTLPPKKIRYILYGPIYGLPDGWCVMNF